MDLAIEIGGTKLQLAVGQADGKLHALWRGHVQSHEGGEGIRRQIVMALPELLKQAGLTHDQIRGIGIGFGGPTDDTTQSVIKSHHIAGWDNFPLATWMSELVGKPCVISNDADVAGLGEAMFGAGRGYSPIFYITVGTGIGGGLIINGQMYRGCGRGAAEIGHLRVRDGDILESYSAGWGIEARANALQTSGTRYTARDVARLAQEGTPWAQGVMDQAIAALAEAIQQMIKLLCPRRIVIGGGVSLIGEERFFQPLRARVADGIFPPFAGLTEIVPAELGEEVVLHGALALAAQTFGR